MTERLLRVSQIIGDDKADPPIPAILPIGRTTLHELVKRGEFPQPVKITNKTVAWRESDVQAYIDRLIVASAK